MDNNPLLKLVIRGIRRKQAQLPLSKSRLPITPKILRDLVKQLHRDPTITQHDKLMLQAAMLLAFFSFLRVSEFTTTAGSTSRFLSRGDVKLMDHQLKVFLCRSKTDQLGKGSTITVGCSEDGCCPVRAMRLYLEECRSHPSKPLFHFRHGPPLTARNFRAVLHFHLKSLGLKARCFNTHSVRIGAATAAAKAGLQSSTLKELGRWRSAAFHSYIRHDPAHPSAAALMAKAD